MSFTNHPMTVIGVIVGCSVLGLVALVLLGLFLTSRGKTKPKEAVAEEEHVAYTDQREAGPDSILAETEQIEKPRKPKRKKKPKTRDRSKSPDEMVRVMEKEQDSAHSVIDDAGFIYPVDMVPPKLGDDFAQLKESHGPAKPKSAASDTQKKPSRKAPGEKKRPHSQPGLGSPSGTAEKKEKSPEKRPVKSPLPAQKKLPDKKPDTRSPPAKTTEKKQDKSPSSSALSQSSSEDGKREKTEGKREKEDQSETSRKKRGKHDEAGTQSEEKSHRKHHHGGHHSGRGSRRHHSSHHHQGTKTVKPKVTA